MSSLSWLGKTLCPPDCLVKSDIKAPSCAAIFRLGIVVLQCVRTGEVFCGLHVAHVHVICPVRDVTHVRKCTRPSPAFPYCKRRKAGRGPGNEAIIPPLWNSDHHGIILSLKRRLLHKSIASKKRSVWRYKHADFTRARSLLNSVSWDQVLSMNINLSWDIWQNKFMEVMENCIPRGTLPEKWNLPWLDKSIVQAIKR